VKKERDPVPLSSLLFWDREDEREGELERHREKEEALIVRERERDWSWEWNWEKPEEDPIRGRSSGGARGPRTQ
jgi:hypothetical protein